MGRENKCAALPRNFLAKEIVKNTPIQFSRRANFLIPRAVLFVQLRNSSEQPFDADEIYFWISFGVFDQK